MPRKPKHKLIDHRSTFDSVPGPPPPADQIFYFFLFLVYHWKCLELMTHLVIQFVIMLLMHGIVMKLELGLPHKRGGGPQCLNVYTFMREGCDLHIFTGETLFPTLSLLLLVFFSFSFYTDCRHVQASSPGFKCLHRVLWETLSTSLK